MGKGHNHHQQDDQLTVFVDETCGDAFQEKDTYGQRRIRLPKNQEGGCYHRGQPKLCLQSRTGQIKII